MHTHTGTHTRTHTRTNTVRYERNSSNQALLIKFSWNTFVNEVKGRIEIEFYIQRLEYGKSWSKIENCVLRTASFPLIGRDIYNWQLWKLNMLRFSVYVMMERNNVLAELNYRKFWSWSEKVLKLGNKGLQIFRRELTVVWRGIYFWWTTVWAERKKVEIHGKGPGMLLECSKRW